RMGFGNVPRLAQSINKRRKGVAIMRSLGPDIFQMPQSEAHQFKAATVQCVNRFGLAHLTSIHKYTRPPLSRLSLGNRPSFARRSYGLRSHQIAKPGLQTSQPHRATARTVV